MCNHANDSDFRFCQLCGYQRKYIRAVVSRSLTINLEQIDRCLNQSQNFDKATSYSKQKDALQKELETFLAGRVTLATATPRDLFRFLIFKDAHGKMQVHHHGRSFLGQRRIQSCGCPVRLSYKTVDSCIGKLHSIFHASGRDGEWDKRFGWGNPAADKSLKDYLCLVMAEQLQARVTQKQAAPFFVNKLTQLSVHLHRALGNAPTPSQRFVVARDPAYFKTVFFSGDRPGNLGQVKVKEILRFPNDDGFLFNHIWGKTQRNADKNVFGDLSYSGY